MKKRPGNADRNGRILICHPFFNNYISPGRDFTGAILQ
jgi:hypothetical protein